VSIVIDLSWFSTIPTWVYALVSFIYGLGFSITWVASSFARWGGYSGSVPFWGTLLAALFWPVIVIVILAGVIIELGADYLRSLK
jgi:hypothetical protein